MATRLRSVCEASKCCPMSGSATLATARPRFATVATAISDASTHPARSGAAEVSESVLVAVESKGR